MRIKFLIASVAVVLMAAIMSCGNNGSSSSASTPDSTNTVQDNSSTTESASASSGQEDLNKHSPSLIPDNPLPTSIDRYDLKAMADSCVSTYKQFLANHDPRLKATTESVSYKTKDLQNWLLKVQNSDSIYFKIGVYKPEFIAAINDLRHRNIKDEDGKDFKSLDPIKDRFVTTIFLFAYDKQGKPYMIAGKESSAYNLGNLHP